MKPHATRLYVCPSCHGNLTLRPDDCPDGEVLEGMLSCQGCGREYPVIRGVPRFVQSGGYASTFGRQWNWFRTVQLDSHNGTSESASTLQTTTGWTESDFKDRLVLDAGVGAGRFAECASAQGGTVFGVESTEAVDAAFANIGRHPRVHLAQADIFQLPFRPETFDLAYSIGVLHHTPDTQGAFRKVAETVRQGGQMAVYLYARYGPSHHASDLIRRVTTRLPPRVVLGLSAAAIPLHYLYRLPGLGSVLHLALPISPVNNWRWRWLDTFDWYSPTYQWKFLYPEVARWFRACGFRDIEIFDGPIRMRASKVAPTDSHHAQRVDSELVAS